ncbi:MAG TPA: D-glycero-beta-D-manno-heptose-7-phosphate kinase [Pyrinomonadaceae bacterium]|nr:D-glycero-beta-D-manno-heptose-7-phosphate kinase [Pyrinomonadaceae bacterium]
MNLPELIKRFSKVKVLVVGDVMIDRYCWGEITRISPEAPVPVVALAEMSHAAGGAANVAANVAGLGAKPFLFGITGDDADAADLPDILRDAGIKRFSLAKIRGRQTSVKTRIVANNQHVVRIDHESTSPITKKDIAAIWPKLSKAIDGNDVVVISDYAKGFLTDEVLSRLISRARRSKKIVLVDPKGKDFSRYKGATVITPNERETAEACHVDSHRPDLIERAVKMLLEELNLEALLVTQGSRGMTLLQKGKHIVHLKASARKVFDVTGAGDTVIASLAVALGSGADMVDSATFANVAAGLVVEQVGTRAISLDLFSNG